MGSLYDLIVNKVFPALWEQRSNAVDVLRILASRWYAFSATILLFSISLTLLLVSLERSEHYEAVVGKVISTTEASQNETSLDSLLLSGIEPDVIKNLKEERLDSSFEETWNQLVVDAQKTVSSQPFPIRLASGFPGSQTLTEPQDNAACPPTKPASSPGFLFAPYYLLQPPLDPGNEQRVIDEGTELDVWPSDPKKKPEGLKAAVPATSPSLFAQIALSHLVAESMQKLAGTSMIGRDNQAASLLAPVPVQSYLVMSGGIMRVFIHDDPHPTIFFGNQFPPTTFFPSRPYFWPTFADRPSFYSRIISQSSTPQSAANKSKAPIPYTSSNAANSNLFVQRADEETTVGQFFRVSQPYLDLGGSGVVITLTRGLIVDGVSRMVVCIDLRFDDDRGVAKLLHDTIGSLNGKIYRLDCTVAKGSQRLACGDDGSLPEEEGTMYRSVKNQFLQSPTRVLSNIYRFDEGSTVKFSLPLDRTINTDGSQQLTLMLASFDLKKYKDHTTYIAAGAATAFGLLTMFLAYLWGSLEVGSKRFEVALREVDLVMGYCPTPYIHLDTEDVITYANEAFKTQLFGANAPDLEKQKIKLGDMCADPDSKKEYSRVEQERKAGDTGVKPYFLNLKYGDMPPVRMKVVGAGVPTQIRNALPGTFGILLVQDS